MTFRAPGPLVALVFLAMITLAAVFAPLVAPRDVFDPARLNLSDAFDPPLSRGMDGNLFLLGTDGQGRDILSTILFGARISLGVAAASITLAMVVGVVLGLVAAAAGGVVDAILMRVADVQLSFPPILVALLVDGIARAALPASAQGDQAMIVLILAIGLSSWVQFARTVRAMTIGELGRDYVAAARVTGASSGRILFGHVLINVLGPVLVIGTIGFALAIITESTLSFLGVGVPPTQPSIGTLIRVGNEFLFSGEWWITVFPGVALICIVLAVNVLGDRLRDIFDPRAV